jgi:hypothetical protein
VKPRSPLAAASTNRGSQLTIVRTTGEGLADRLRSEDERLACRDRAGAAKCSKAGPLPSSTERAENAASVASSSLSLVWGNVRLPLRRGIEAVGQERLRPAAVQDEGRDAQSPLSVRRQ